MNNLLKGYFSDNFKGVWIPREIFFSSELSLEEKFILAVVDTLSVEGDCYANNGYFAKLCGCRGETISRHLTRLESLGYIKRDKMHGTSKRIIKSNMRITSNNLCIDKMTRYY